MGDFGWPPGFMSRQKSSQRHFGDVGTMQLLYRPLDQDTINNPYPIYDRLRIEEPVFWHDQTNSWVLSRYQDCRFVLNTHELFARDRRRVGMRLPTNQDNLQVQDPPIHTEFRNVLSSAFRKQDLTLLVSAARAKLEANVLQRMHQAPFDFMSEVATEVALDISLQLIGAVGSRPLNYHFIFEEIAKQMDSAIDPGRRGGTAATSALRSLMQAWMATPTTAGLIGALREVASPKFENDYITNTMCGVFNACYSTLYALTGSVLLAALTNRNLIQLHSNVATDVAAKEFIRYISPAQGATRYAVAPVEIGNKTIQRGDCVIILFAAANRDPETFHMPEKLVLDRSPNPHLGFGSGSHFCIGAAVASLWVRELLSFIQDKHERLALFGNHTYMNLATLRCLQNLQVRLSTG